MKRILFVTISILLSSILFAQPNEKTDRYLIKSGYVEYELTGSTKGIKKIWWDNYGDKERIEIKSSSEIKVFGMVQKEEVHSIHISNGDKFWHANLIDGTGVKGSEEYYDQVDINEDMTDAEREKFEEDMLNAFGGERLPPESFLGYTCEVVKVLGAKVWVYKGVTLKSTAKMLGVEVNETATKFDANIKVDESKFEPPKDIEFIEGTYEE